MSRLKRFEDHRFIGDRRTMRVYDCDDEQQFEHVMALATELDLLRANELQTFAPDDLLEARNRGFSLPRGQPSVDGRE